MKYLIFLFLFSSSLFARNYGTSFRTIALTDAKLSVDPPFPSPKNEKGVFKMALQPIYYKGDYRDDKISTAGGNIVGTGDFDGKGFAFNATYGMGERWGLMSLGLVNNFEGTFKNDYGTIVDDFLGIKGESYTLGIGANVDFMKLLPKNQIKDLPVDFGFSMFGGGFYKWSNYKQTIIRKNSTGTITYLDFDMESSPTFGGIFLGQAIESRFGKNKFWGLQFFMLELAPMFADTCQPYEVTAVRQEDPTVGLTSSAGTCSNDPAAPQSIRYDLPFLLTFSLRVLIGPYISVNVLTPFFEPTLSLGDDDGLSTSVYSINFNFTFGGEKKNEKGLTDQIMEYIN